MRSICNARYRYGLTTCLSEVAWRQELGYFFFLLVHRHSIALNPFIDSSPLLWSSGLEDSWRWILLDQALLWEMRLEVNIITAMLPHTPRGFVALCHAFDPASIPAMKASRQRSGFNFTAADKPSLLHALTNVSNW